MQEVWFTVISFLLATAAFVYGALKLFKSKTPLYFIIIVCAAGCFMLKEISSMVSYFCGGYDGYASIGELATFGCALFLFSANYGQMDGVVEGKSVSKRIKLLSCIPPLIFTGLSATAVATRADGSPLNAVIMLIAVLPMIASSYFNTKHLIMPMDDLRLLSTTKWCNIFSLVYFVCTYLYLLSPLSGSVLIAEFLSVLTGVIVLCLTISAERGCQKWKNLL